MRQDAPFDLVMDIAQTAGQVDVVQPLITRLTGQAQMLRLDHLAIAQRDGLEQHVLQLTHVARPVIALQARHGLGRDIPYASADLTHRALEEMSRQLLEPIQTFPERRNLHTQHIEAMEEIVAEAPFAAQCRQVLLSGADHAHIEEGFLIAADAPETAVLQKAQQLDLHARTHLADLIQEDGAAAGQLQQAQLALRPRALEGTRGITEQLRLGHRFRQPRAIERHEGGLAARACQVAGPRQQLLAGAGLTLDQERRIQRCHAASLLDHRRQLTARLEYRFEATHLGALDLIDTRAQAVCTMQGDHGARQRGDILVLGMQWRDIGEEGLLPHPQAQAIDAGIVAPDQLRQVDILDVTRQRQPRHLIDAHPEQLARRAIGRHHAPIHVDGHHRV